MMPNTEQVEKNFFGFQWLITAGLDDSKSRKERHPKLWYTDMMIPVG